MRIIILAAALAALALPVRAEWTEDAEICASHPAPGTVLAACTRALDSGLLDTQETARTHANRAWAHLQFADFGSARDDLRIAIDGDKDGGRASAWNLLGIVHEQLGEITEAENAYLRALAQHERQGGEEQLSAGVATDVAATTNLARLYERNAMPQAGEWARKAFDLAPEHPGMQDIYRKHGFIQ